MIAASEKKRMYNIPLVAENVVLQLEKIGVCQIEDLKGKTPTQVINEINEKAGHKVLAGPMAYMAITNLIDAADGRQF